MAARRSDYPVERPSRSGIVHLIKHSDPIALIGVALSCGLSIALDVTGAASGVQSLLAGLMATTISLVLDASARAERRFRLLQIVEATDWLPDQVALMASAIEKITERYPGSVVEAEARHRVHRMVEELEGMRLGRTARPRGDFSHVINTTENCRASLDAVTNVITYPHWWQSELAKRYWAANKAAVDRGVRVRRVFIYDQLTDDLRALVDEQRDAGVEVAIVRHQTLDPESLRNFAVWDDQSAWEGQMNAHAEMVSNVLVVNAQEVSRFVELFQRCWESAHRYGTGL